MEFPRVRKLLANFRKTGNDPTAISEHDRGDRESARRCYQRILELELESEDASGRIELSDYRLAASQGLKALERGEPSAWQARAYNSDGEPLPVPRAAPHTQERPPKGKRHRSRKRRRKAKKQT